MELGKRHEIGKRGNGSSRKSDLGRGSLGQATGEIPNVGGIIGVDVERKGDDYVPGNSGKTKRTVSIEFVLFGNNSQNNCR